MKKYFITGLIISLPLGITVVIFNFLIDFFTKPFIGVATSILQRYGWLEGYTKSIHFGLQILLLLALFFFIVLLGFLTKILLFRYILGYYDSIMHRIPIIKTFYKATQQIIQAVFGQTTRSFKQVVLVPFPVQGAYAIGLVSSPAPALCEEAAQASLINVFVPTTPNPTSGYLMMYRKEEVRYLDMKIEDALKYIISCGVITEANPVSIFDTKIP